MKAWELSEMLTGTGKLGRWRFNTDLQNLLAESWWSERVYE